MNTFATTARNKQTPHSSTWVPNLRQIDEAILELQEFEFFRPGTYVQKRTHSVQTFL